jgi:hypothetical protein
MGIIPDGGCHHVFGSRVILPTEVQHFILMYLDPWESPGTVTLKSLSLVHQHWSYMTMKDISRSLQLFSTKASST